MGAGGRPRQIGVEDIVKVGRELGLPGLSLNTVAARLGVSAAALYRHVNSRLGLEKLVGESLLGDWQITEQPQHTTEQYLLSFGLQLRQFLLQRPGLVLYMQASFPNGPQGERLLGETVMALGRRGYPPEVAIVLASTVASLVLGYVTTEEYRLTKGRELEQVRDAALAEAAADKVIGPYLSQLPQLGWEQYVGLILPVHIRGLLAVALPGRSLSDILAELSAAGATDGV